MKSLENSSKALLILFIKVYQRTFSFFLGGNCRFYPTCSDYTLQAVDKFGVRKGLWKGMQRISKCHPFGSHGFDPIQCAEKNDAR